MKVPGSALWFRMIIRLIYWRISRISHKDDFYFILEWKRKKSFGIIRFTFGFREEDKKKPPFDNPKDAHIYPYDNPTQILGRRRRNPLNSSTLSQVRSGREDLHSASRWTQDAAGHQLHSHSSCADIWLFFVGVFVLLSTNESWIQFETRRQSCRGIDNK